MKKCILFLLTKYCKSLEFLLISPLPVKYYSLVQKLGNRAGSWQFKIADFISSWGARKGILAGV